MEEILGYLSAILIGVCLGLLGGGGSILSIPVLAYLFNVDEKLATAYSLFIVGATAAVGGFRQAKKGLVNWRIVLIFGVPALIGLTLVRRLLIPNLPEELFHLGGITITRRILMFGLFALLMIPAAFSMLKKREMKDEMKNDANSEFNLPLIITSSVLLGAILGFVGAGGGFLLIPILVFFAKLPMKSAVATSLVLIAINSLLGFLIGDAFTQPIDWKFLGIVTGLALVGIYIGTHLSQFINGKSLRKSFGYFIIIMAIFIFYMEFFVKN